MRFNDSATIIKTGNKLSVFYLQDFVDNQWISD